MTRKEKIALETIHDALAIPFPAMYGTQSATISGYAGFAVDMRAVLDDARTAMRLLATGESYEGQLDEYLTNLRKATAARKQ